MAKRKGPTPKRVHRADSDLVRDYARLYEHVGKVNAALVAERLRVDRLEQELAAARDSLRITCDALASVGA